MVGVAEPFVPLWMLPVVVEQANCLKLTTSLLFRSIFGADRRQHRHRVFHQRTDTLCSHSQHYQQRAAEAQRLSGGCCICCIWFICSTDLAVSQHLFPFFISHMFRFHVLLWRSVHLPQSLLSALSQSVSPLCVHFLFCHVFCSCRLCIATRTLWLMFCLLRPTQPSP